MARPHFSETKSISLRFVQSTSIPDFSIFWLNFWEKDEYFMYWSLKIIINDYSIISMIYVLFPHVFTHFDEKLYLEKYRSVPDRV